MLLHEAFLHSAARLPDKTAIVSGHQRVAYERLLGDVLSLACVLRDAGIDPGDRVVILLENSIEYVVAVHAVLVAGGVIVPVSATTKCDKVAFILADTKARALLTHALLAPAWAPAIERSPSLTVCCVAGTPAVAQDDARVRLWPTGDEPVASIEPSRIDEDLAALIYTSGSTGMPKGVMLTHLSMTSAWSSVQAYLGLRDSDVIGLALSPVHSYGLYNMLMGLGLGATVVLERGAAFPVKVADMLVRERVTVFPGVPTLFGALLGLREATRFDFGAVRILTNAAAALSVTHIERLRALFPRAQLYSMYGLTECIRVTFLPPDELDRRPTSVGRGMPNQQHWLVGEDGLRLPHGSTGELVVRGSHVMRGYWGRPEATADRLRPGDLPGELVLHTGDLFRTDSEGFLHFVARKDDIINTRGEQVAPREIENAICELEGVAECAVVGVADEALGQAIKAYVSLEAGATLGASDIIKHCLARLENHLAPKFVEFVDALPRTDSGKIRHASLRP